MKKDMIELQALVGQGLAKRWGMDNREASERIKEELAVIEAVGCADYFLMVAKLVEAIRSAGGLVGPGRGVSGGSAVCYALGITGVDPLKHGLIFERFLHRGLKHVRSILIDVDEVGEIAGRRYLEERFTCAYETRKSNVAPQYVTVDGCGEIGLTRIAELDRIAEVMRHIKAAGKEVPDLDALSDGCDPCVAESGEFRYDEDLMLVAQKEAKLDAETSDAFRKAVCKALRDRAEGYRHLFAAGRWEQMWEAANGLLPKAHCVCQARLYSQMAYLKCHYPLEWDRCEIQQNGGTEK